MYKYVNQALPDNRRPTVMLLGATGHLGQTLKATQPNFMNGLLHCPNSKMVNLTQQVSIERAIGFLARRHQLAIVINAAAYTQVEGAEQNAELAYAVNVLGSRYLAKACAQARIPLIHFSTDYVFDGRQQTPYQESDRANPLNIYGRTKYLAEKEVKQYCAQHWIFRVSWLHGQYGANFANQMIRLAKNRIQENQPISMVQDQMGSPTDTKRLAQCIWYLVEHYLTYGQQTTLPSWGLYHLTTSWPCSRLDYAKSIFKAAYQQRVLPKMPQIKPIQMQDFPAIAKRPKYSALRCHSWFAPKLMPATI